jgi:hypothetical protein
MLDAVAANRKLFAVIGPGDEAVERHAHVYNYFGHFSFPPVDIKAKPPFLLSARRPRSAHLVRAGRLLHAARCPTRLPRSSTFHLVAAGDPGCFANACADPDHVLASHARRSASVGVSVDRAYF